MEAALYIAGAIALLALAALLLYMTTVLKEVKGLLANVSTTVNDVSKNLNDQLRNLDHLVGNVSALTDDIVSVVDDTTAIVHEGQRIVVSIMELEQHIQNSLQVPIVETVGIVAALGKGIRSVRMKVSDAIGGDAGLEIAGFETDRRIVEPRSDRPRGGQNADRSPNGESNGAAARRPAGVASGVAESH